MAVFLKENFSPESLKRASLEERLARFRGFRQQAQSLRPEKMLRDTGDEASYLVLDGQGELLEFTFQFEKDKEARIASVMGAPIDAESVAELSGPPLSREEILARVRALLDESVARRPIFGSSSGGPGRTSGAPGSPGNGQQGIRGCQRGRHAL